MTRSCDLDPHVVSRAPSTASRSGGLEPPSRRDFMKRVGLGFAGLTCADFLAYFRAFGMPRAGRSAAMAADASDRAADPRYLIYWFLEGGWSGYDMFNPVVTPNNIHHRLEDISAERYRVLHFGEENYGIYRRGNIRYGFLASPGVELFDDMAVISSMSTGTGHSRDRLRCHMGTYSLNARADREDDERSVLQAFAEAYGQPYALPHVSWHWWLSDGELNEAQYTGRKGYYHALGPVHAHTIYAGTPRRLRKLLRKRAATTGNLIHREVQRFIDHADAAILRDENIEAVRSYNSAREIYRQLSQRGRSLDAERMDRLFTDPALREEFGVHADDELLTYRSVNGNKARTKFSPQTNVQAMMAYELLREGLSCAAWIESRDVRRFDSHNSRRNLWRNGKPVGQKDQSDMMREDLWEPLKAFVARLKSTPCGKSGDSFFDRTTIVVTSEFGRSIHGDVSRVLKSNASEKERRKQIGGQDISAHWPVTSAAFLGSDVRGNSQFGGVGEVTLRPIPLLPDGQADPAYHPKTGELIEGRRRDPRSAIPDHGSIYATALMLSGIDPRGKGRNERGPLRFVSKRYAWF